jgi:hypothetical protein
MVTLLMELGYSKDEIKTLGRWSSDRSFNMYWNGGCEQLTVLQVFNFEESQMSSETGNTPKIYKFAPPVYYKNTDDLEQSMSGEKRINKGTYQTVNVDILANQECL